MQVSYVLVLVNEVALNITKHEQQQKHDHEDMTNYIPALVLGN